MKRLLLIIFMLFITLACDDSSNTEDLGLEHLNTDITTPIIGLSNGLIVWDEIEGVTEYEILIVDYTPNDSCYIMHHELVHVTNNQFNIESLTDNHQWDVKVRAVIDHEFSLYSQPIIIDTFKDLHVAFDVSMNIQSTDEYLVVPDEVEDVLFISYQVAGETRILDTEDYKIANQRLMISKGALSFIEESYDLYLYTKEGIDTLKISLVDQSNPSLLTGDYIVYDGADIVSVFDLAGGTFRGFLGDLITGEDYRFEHGILVIEHSFIDALFEKEENRESLVLTYQIDKDDKRIEGYIFIQKQG